MKPLNHLKTIFILNIVTSILFFNPTIQAQNLAQLNPSPDQEKIIDSENKDNEIKSRNAEISHAPKSYITEEGRVYWNKSQPVYISLLTSPEDTDGIIMKVDQNKEVQPYYFDTEGVNFIRTRWRVDTETGETIYPKEEVLWPVVADGIAPAVWSDFIATGKHVKNGTTYFSGDLQVALHASDKTSGVESVFYSLGEDFKTYANPVSINSEKQHELSYYAVDRVGNFSKPEKSSKTIVNFVIDATPPSTNLSVVGPNLNNILSSKAFIRLNSTDQESGVKKTKYIISGGSKKTYLSDISLASLTDGSYTLNYSSDDNVGNGEKENSYEFYLDKIAPELKFDASGDRFESPGGKLFLSKRSKIVLTGTDNKAGVDKIHFKVDNNDYSVYSTPINISQSEGVHKVEYYGIDKVENYSNKVGSTYIIDDTPPVIRYNLEGPQHIRHDTLFLRTISSMSLNPTDLGVNQAGVKTITYRINDQEETSFEKSFSFTTEGLNHLKIESKDQVNNSSELSKIIFIDNIAPTISTTFSVKKIGQKVVRDINYPIYPVETKLYLAAKDESVGSQSIYYKLNDQPEKLYTTPLKNFKLGANINLEIRALDILGNEETSSIKFSVE